MTAVAVSRPLTATLPAARGFDLDLDLSFDLALMLVAPTCAVFWRCIAGGGGLGLRRRGGWVPGRCHAG